ncbi:MAG: arginine deiminase family protein [Gemmatimonadales bacterium]
MTIALTRGVQPTIVDCELTYLDREPIDFHRAVEQHEEYEKALADLGCTIERLPSLPDNPDSVFVEDTAVVLAELTIITRPGAPSRRAEVTSVADAMRRYRGLAFIDSPGTLDGGDVLTIGRAIYVGASTRTNADGIRQLAQLTTSYGYTVRTLTTSSCLHLKSAVTQVAEDVVLLNSDWVDSSAFEKMRLIEVHPAEPFAANALWIGDSVIYPTGFDETSARLERFGIKVVAVETGELQKAEGAVTCCSIIVGTGPFV